METECESERGMTEGENLDDWVCPRVSLWSGATDKADSQQTGAMQRGNGLAVMGITLGYISAEDEHTENRPEGGLGK